MSVNVEEKQIVFEVQEDSQVAITVETTSVEFAIAENSTDLNAIHKNLNGEINSLTAKDDPVGNDLVIIEDSEDSNKKKKARISDITGSSGVSSVNGLTGAVTLTIPDQLSDLSEDSTHRVVTDSEKSTWNAKQSAIGYTPENQANKINSSLNDSSTEYPTSGLVRTALQSKADLVDGLVPSNQLPSYVDDVVEYNNLASFPVTGAVDKIYVAKDTNVIYRWSGSAYVEISSSLALGETSGTAYRGDRGKTAYDHSQVTGNPHGSTTANIADSNDKRYVTEAEKTKLANTSGTNTGDQVVPDGLDDFADVDLTGLADGDLLIRLDGAWKRDSVDNIVSGQSNVSYAYTHANIYGSNPHGIDLSLLLDVLITSIQDAQILQFNASEGKFINVALDKTLVGLGNVDNTSDADKPISDATQTALNTKLEEEVDPVWESEKAGYFKKDTDDLDDIQEGTTNKHFTGTEKTKLSGIETGATADQIASEVPVTPTGNMASSNVQSALQEHQGDIDSINSSLGGLTDAVVLKGTWDASSGTFPGSGSAQAGWSYIVSVAGTVDGVAFAQNDRLLAIVDNASASVFASNWHKLDYTDQVLSVNGETGAVTIDSDDISDTGKTHKFTTASEITKLSGIESSADVTDAGNVGSSIHGVTGKTTPVDADTVPLINSESSNNLFKVTWANIKATLKTYFDTLYNLYAHPNHTGDVTSTGDGATVIGANKVTEAMQNISDNTTKDVSTSAHGYVPKAPNDTTKYLRGDGTWSVVANMYLTENPSDVSSTGTKVVLTAGESLVFGDICYIKSDGKMWKADANGSATYPAVFMANGTISADATGTFLMMGIARNDAWTWTVGGTIYLSTTAGGMTQTQPSATDEVIQVLGIATHADRMLFKPSIDYITHT